MNSRIRTTATAHDTKCARTCVWPFLNAGLLLLLLLASCGPDETSMVTQADAACASADAAEGLAAGGSKCAPPMTRCKGACVNLQTDPNNCGRCGNVCPTSAEPYLTCSAGTCVCNRTVGCIYNGTQYWYHCCRPVCRNLCPMG